MTNDYILTTIKSMNKIKIWPLIVIPLLLVFGALMGAALGRGLAETQNVKNTEFFTEFETSLPTRILDINGELITEYAGDESREIIEFNDLPSHMVEALVTREDRIFYKHKGFSAKALVRALIGQVLHVSWGGGSTLSQQIAGTLYCDRTDISVKRKLKELWWSIQMERRYSKNEILELYLNKIYFGGGTYGVNAASKYYFGHGAREITPAEAAILVIQLSNPSYYNPFEHPNRALDRQQYVLDAMVEQDYLTREEADESFDNYWANFDYTRTGSSAYELRVDEAPWFSEYVRREFSSMLYGTDDIYTSGYTVNTSLNLSHQKEAEVIMADYIKYANDTYQHQVASRQKDAFARYIPFTELISLISGNPKLKVSEQRAENVALKAYSNEVNPILDIVALMTGMDTFKTEIVNKGNQMQKRNSERTTIEGTMIALENSTGYIDALVGGSKYDSDNQFIRAIQARVQPGSTIKPLYYSAAIDSRKFTMATTVSDTPVVFAKDDGSPYIPQDFLGEYMGDVQIWFALAHSMNIPSIKVLDGIGFDAAIYRITSLYGIPQEEWQSRGFQPVYPLGLGVVSVRPVEVAKAFATIANQGREVTPIAILNVEDKDGNVIRDPERELREAEKAKGSSIQIISQQNAFIMTEMLKRTVSTGTLQNPSDFKRTKATIGKDKGTGYKFIFKDANGNDFYMPVGGKTGTTQNWADAWTVGFTPYYTAAFWFGFDRPGQSLGTKLTGSTLAGVAWSDYMNFVNQGKPYKDFFQNPPNGVVKMVVCSVSGDIPTEDCGKNKTTAYFLAGTEPTEECIYHSNHTPENLAIERLWKAQYKSGIDFGNLDNDTGLNEYLDLINSINQDTGTDGTNPENDGSTGEYDLDAILNKINSSPESVSEDDEDSSADTEENSGNWLLD